MPDKSTTIKEIHSLFLKFDLTVTHPLNTKDVFMRWENQMKDKTKRLDVSPLKKINIK